MTDDRRPDARGEADGLVIEAESAQLLTPHSKAIIAAGEAMLVDSITTGREFCQSMITTSAAAVPVYLGILALVRPEATAPGLVVALPALAFLLASVVFTFGYLPVTGEFSLDVLDEVEEERNRVIGRRRKLIWIGMTVFVAASVGAIAVAVWGILGSA